MHEKLKSRSRRGCLLAVIALAGLVLLLAGISALTDIGLPQPGTSDRLPELDKARLAEALQLKAELGEQVWPGWGKTRAAAIVFNRAYEFLLAYPGQPPAGWEAVPEESFDGQAYYRRPASNPQNFAVQIGGQWIGSMAAKADTDAFLIGTFRDLFPSPLKQVFPYRLLIQPSETQIGGVLHEDFHAFQMRAAPQRMETAEQAHRLGDRYESTAGAFTSGLKQEYALLAKALAANSEAGAAVFVRTFLQMRDDRRQANRVPAELVDYERWLEWEEGMAKYVEVNSLRQAHLAPAYTPLAEMSADPDFKGYRRFDSRWSQEMFQLRNPSGSLETQFYNSGMAECFLLDRLLPGWQSRALQPGFFLEDLLREAAALK